MTDRGLRVAGLGIGAFTLALVATTVVLVVATDGQAANQFEDSWAEIASAVLTLGGTGAGLAILWRRPRNRIGWVLLLPALGLASEDAAVAAVNTTHVVLATPSLATEILAVVSDALWLPSTGVGIVALFLLFPDGRPTGRVARWALRVVVVASGAYALAILLGEGPLYALATVDNPMGIPGSRPLLEPVVGVATGVVFLGGLVGLGSLVRRWRSAGPHTRAQLKWFLAAAALTVVTVTAVSLLAEDSGTQGSWWTVLPDVATVAVLAAIAIAVTRHRLFEIDRLISRSLTYSVVVATLAGVYALLVVGLQAVRSPVAASSDLAVAASTLAVAALFGPVVRRVRRVVDRRFDRSAYDAAQITERFGHRLRDRVDLDEVVGTFEDTVGAAVQPCSVSLWLSTENA